MDALCHRMDEWPFAYRGILAHLLCMSWHYQRVGANGGESAWWAAVTSTDCPVNATSTALLHPQMRPVGEASNIPQCASLNRTVLHRAVLFLYTESFSSFLFTSFHSPMHWDSAAIPLRASHPFLFVCLCNFFHYAHHFRAVLFLLSTASFADARLLGAVRSLHQGSSAGANLN